MACSMDWIHHARTTILLFASAEVVLLAVIALGAVPWNLSRRLGAYMAPSIFQFFGIGAVLLAVPTWYGFHAGVPTRGVFATLVAAAVLAAGWALLRLLRERDLPTRTRAIRRLRLHARDFAILSFFAACVSLWMGLLIRNGDLAVVTIGNNDIFAYAVLSDHLLRHPAAIERVQNFSFHGFLHRDVFGTFAFVAFSAFVMSADPIDIIQTPMVVCCAMVAGSVFWICRDHLKLQTSVSVILALALLSNSLFQYSVLQYFLAQIFSSALLLILIGTAINGFNTSNLKPKWTNFFIAGCLIGGIRYIYPVAVVLHLFTVACTAFLMLVFTTWQRSSASAQRLGPTWRSLPSKLTIVVFACAIGIIIVAPDSFLSIYNKIVFYSKENIVGWPLPFIGALTLLSLPSTFIKPGFATLKTVEVAALLCLGGLALLSIRRIDKRVSPIYSSVFGLLIIYILIYTYIYTKYGPSYQQWKFLASYPTLLGFIVFACLAKAALAQKSRTIAVCLAVGLVFVSANNLSALLKWRERVMRFSSEFPILRGIDTAPGVDTVYVGLPRTAEQMLALNYILQKRVMFSGTTYWGPGGSLATAGDAELAVLRRGPPDCNETVAGQFGTFHLVRADGGLRTGAKVLFAGSLPSCVLATGLGDPEPWGVWSTAHSVSLAFDCDCGASAGPQEVLLTVRPFLAPPALTRQRVLISVDGGPPVRHELSTPNDVTLTVPIPPGDSRHVRIVIQLPDAVAPSKLGVSGDPRQLAIGLISLELRRP
jgi:hypothetical protein